MTERSRSRVGVLHSSERLRPCFARRQAPGFAGRDPILVTVRTSKELGSLRQRFSYLAIRLALQMVAARDDFRVVHFSIQRSHLHMIVEATSKERLSRGMQALLISAARHLKREIEKATGKMVRGAVFSDRYHASVLGSPRQCRNAIAYVLNNWRRHQEDQREVARGWLVDPFSSAVNFGGWKELEGSSSLFQVRESYERLPTCTPETWLLRVGWIPHGLIGAREVPGRAS